MKESLRLDRLGTMRNVKATPQGGLEIPAYLTRTGIFEYTYPGGRTVRELRHPEDVFNADSLATLAHATVTVMHPAEMVVTSANWKREAVGQVGEHVKVDGSFVAASVFVQDADTCARIIGDGPGALKEISGGYRAKLEEIPGTYEGKPYDVRQRDIRYNHVALLPAGGGRQGSDVGLKLDSTYHEGMDIAVSALHCDDAATTAVVTPAPTPPQVLNAADFVTKAEHDKTLGQLDGLTAQLAAATAEVNAAKAQISPASLDALVHARVQLIDNARKLGGADIKTDSLSELEIMCSALTALDPTFKADGKSTDYVRGRFESCLSGAAAVVASHTQVQTITAPPAVKTDSKGTGDKVADAKAANDARNKAAFGSK